MYKQINETGLATISKSLASVLLNHIKQSVTVFLHGDLGVGKTTFVRHFLRACKFNGVVKSPTFTLVEPYTVTAFDGTKAIYHFDLYRLINPMELDEMGIEEYFENDSITFVEWAEKGGEFLPAPDIEIYLNHSERHDYREYRIKVNNLQIKKIVEKLDVLLC